MEDEWFSGAAHKFVIGGRWQHVSDLLQEVRSDAGEHFASRVYEWHRKRALS